MSYTFTVAKSQRAKFMTRARSRFWRILCALVKHRFGKVKYEAYTPSGKPVASMRECWCGRLWAKGGLSNVSAGDALMPARALADSIREGEK